MRLSDWTKYAPVSARKEALARIDAIKTESDEDERLIWQPQRGVANKAYPLIRAFEEANGRRPEKIFLPPEDMHTLRDCFAEQVKRGFQKPCLMDDPVIGCSLFGIRVYAGDELRVE